MAKPASSSPKANSGLVFNELAKANKVRLIELISKVGLAPQKA